MNTFIRCRFKTFPLAVLTFLLLSWQGTSQSTQSNRILFVLDASGSMKGKWNGTAKFDLAKNILINTIDSISKANQKVEFGLRVFGHQSPRTSNNCKDSKLEVAFTKGNAAAIAQKLNQLQPQGQTPIEYTLSEALNDFPDSMANNAIILITDGNETCGGNLCDLAGKMEAKKIGLRPFIVGLGLSDSLKKKFDCLGIFYDVQNEDMLSSTIKVVISRVLNPTTCQINLLNAFGNPVQTNIEMTLYDHLNKAVRYNFIHTLNARGIPDTLFLDPKFEYDLEVHSIPSVWKKEIELIPGTHNIIAAEVPMGTIEIKQDGITGFSSLPGIVRKAGEQEILFVQDANSSQRYLTGNYDLEILTLPTLVVKNVSVEESKTYSVKVPKAGKLFITTVEAGVASIFRQNEKGLEKIFDFGSVKTQSSLNLQPGEYLVIFRPDRGKQSERTKQFSFQILAGKTTSIRL